MLQITSGARKTRAYSKSFFDALEGQALSSAARVVPIILELVQPRSVVDVGCGSGAWLSVFADHGVEDLLGIDGYRPDRLLIPADRFLQCDLDRELRLDRGFDLAVCLEVAEHLRPVSAGLLVGGLARLAPVVIFSAAAPAQGGTEHLNEQWPEYWAALFADRGYEVLDPIRRRVWNDPAVSWWYAQNMLVFVRRDELERRPALEKQLPNTFPGQLNLLHPANLGRLGPNPEFLGLAQLMLHQLRILLRAPKVTVRGLQRTLASGLGGGRGRG